MSSSSLREEFRLSSLTLNYPDHSCFYRSQWNLPSWAYAAWRLFWCVWHIVWLIVSGVRTMNTAPDDTDGVKWFVYASNWTFLLTSIFCLVDFLMVILAARQRARDKTQIDPPEPAPPTENQEILFHGEFTLIDGIKMSTTPCCAQFQWFLFEAVNCTNLLSTIVYWASQHQDGDHIHADIVVFNIINTIFVISNTLVTAIPVRILHFLYSAIFIIIYFIFNAIYYLADGTSIIGSDVTFRPLEWDEAYPTILTIIVGLFLAVPLAHLLFFSLFTLRIYLADKFNQGGGKEESELVTGSHYRKRYSSTAGIEEEGEGKRYQSTGKDTFARENAGFQIEADNR